MGYWKEHQTHVIVVRFFNTVGPRQSERYGMVTPNFVRRALEGQPLIVHGSDRRRAASHGRRRRLGAAGAGERTARVR